MTMKLVFLLHFIIIVIVSDAAEAFECSRFKCRYSQKINYYNQSQIVAATHAISHKAISSDSNQKQKRICINYLSSAKLCKLDTLKMRNCAVIDLSDNLIDEVDGDLFDSHTQLEALMMNRNLLRTLPAGFFDFLVNLKNLTLADNLIEELSLHLFVHNDNLEFLDLSHNRLQNIPPRILSPLKIVKFVSLHKNVCINSGFPEVSLEDLQMQFATKCQGEKHIYAFIIRLVKLAAGLDELIKNKSASATTATSLAEASTIDNPKANEDLETLIASLFWLIAPIILILLAILAAISWAIYRKYFKYTVNARR